MGPFVWLVGSNTLKKGGGVVMYCVCVQFRCFSIFGFWEAKHSGTHSLDYVLFFGLLLGRLFVALALYLKTILWRTVVVCILGGSQRTLVASVVVVDATTITNFDTP